MQKRTFDNIKDFLTPDVNHDRIEIALENFHSGKVVLLGFSGKKASGKDTVSENVSNIFKEQGFAVKNAAYAFPVKQEATSIIASIDAIIRGGVTDKMEHRLGNLYDIPENQMLDLIEIIKPHVGTGTGIPDGWTRNSAVWAFLRYLGTEIRQPQDQLYWVRKTYANVIENASRGDSTFINDVRFTHEVETLQKIGGFVTRINISAESQLARLKSRDGVIPDATALSHSSEIQLDTYDYFDMILDNSENGNLKSKAQTIYEMWDKSKLTTPIPKLDSAN